MDLRKLIFVNLQERIDLMRVLTLIQPWATLVILGEKQIETRSWSTNIRGTIAIHAGKKVDKKVFSDPLYSEVLSNYGITAQNIITSAIIGTCEIVDVKQTELLKPYITEKEINFGDYSPNRYGWILNNVKSIEPIYNVKGMLGFWTYDM